MYKAPSIAKVGTVHGLTLAYPQNCKYGYGDDNYVPGVDEEGLADLNGEWKPSCVS